MVILQDILSSTRLRTVRNALGDTEMPMGIGSHEKYTQESRVWAQYCPACSFPPRHPHSRPVHFLCFFPLISCLISPPHPHLLVFYTNRSTAGPSGERTVSKAAAVEHICNSTSESRNRMAGP